MPTSNTVAHLIFPLIVSCGAIYFIKRVVFVLRQTYHVVWVSSIRAIPLFDMIRLAPH